MWPLVFPSACLGCERLLRDDLHSHRALLCTCCQRQHAPLPSTLADVQGIQAIWSYDGPYGRAVVRLKFGGSLALAGPLGRLLAADPRLRRTAGGERIDALVPVPLHWRRRVLRGFDQTEAIARWALRELELCGLDRPRLVRALRRVRPTRPQSSLDAPARELNVAGAFELRPRVELAGRHVLLLDDVTTTGATARACIEALRRARPASIQALALLRAL